AGGAAAAGWGLVVFDEADHLRGARAYEVAHALSRASWGLLLLTATPLQLDPGEYHALLRLVDPAPPASEEELRARLARQGDLSTEVRALLAGDSSAARRIAALFPEDPDLKKLEGTELLAHLSESYGLSARLLRNRRAVVGGFTPRLQLARPQGKRKGIEALAYAGDLSPAERDKLVARFRDPEGPRVLLCTELGGEGRNFQHCHVLVNYDLAWSPAAIEQRIGRIDRIGQSREVRIFAFRPEATLAARVLDLLDEAVGVFRERVGGLEYVLESVESELTALGARVADDEKVWERTLGRLSERVAAG